ncbi:unnamed protein product [Soboliphyme baturini]|uniref:N-acetyltransferase domain-containing protein n=1 Tax=Soboliphyme baturini TaxID=241478 RepID=A0A183IQT8_9BILA|nr:unnamed protein product [Soboliphyme baturini]
MTTVPHWSCSFEISEGQFVIETPTSRDAEELLLYLHENFRDFETLNKAIGISKEEIEPIFVAMVNETTVQPSSYVVRNRDDGRINSCVLNSVRDLNQLKPTDVSQLSAKAQKIVRLIEEVRQPVVGLDSSTGKLLEIVIISVAETHARRGLAKMLIQLCAGLARQTGCSHMFAEATGFKSQALFANMSFETLNEIKHTDHREQGKDVFPMEDGKTDGIKLMFRCIE